MSAGDLRLTRGNILDADDLLTWLLHIFTRNLQYRSSLPWITMAKSNLDLLNECDQ